MEKFIAATGFDQKDDLRLFFDLFRDSNRTVAKNVTLALSDETVRGLMTPVPFQLRSYLEPSDLLPKLGITSASPDAQALKEGIAVLIGEPSGSYQVDEPFLDALYQVMAERAEDNALDTAQLILDSPFPLEGMILAQPEAAATIFRNNIEIALSLATNSDSLLAPPWRIIYRLIKADRIPPGRRIEAGCRVPGLSRLRQRTAGTIDSIARLARARRQILGRTTPVGRYAMAGGTVGRISGSVPAKGGRGG